VKEQEVARSIRALAAGATITAVVLAGSAIAGANGPRGHAQKPVKQKLVEQTHARVVGIDASDLLGATSGVVAKSHTGAPAAGSATADDQTESVDPQLENAEQPEAGDDDPAEAQESEGDDEAGQGEQADDDDQGEQQDAKNESNAVDESAEDADHHAGQTDQSDQGDDDQGDVSDDD
jgi:hypothetical protein